ncbi:nitrate reductase [Aquirhabdus parva]|uniref:Nitrate reductase n=2 Tax=Aquirhabdus parva TaxID=2283318 RepID=A0A345P6L1_9GAMM|nr:nitrate reductase [Aquirhabdus parva]
MTVDTVLTASLRGEAIKTTCAYCGVGCGVLATVDADRHFSISGDLEHPANFGRLCVKGSALGETVGLEGRLLYPAIGGVRADWDHTTTYIASQLKDIIAEHGPEAVAFYVSGQFLTEDYYVVNKLAKGFIGTPNVDTNSRLCMSSAVAGHKRAFGTDTVPNSYEDFEHADLLTFVGSNAAWCHPILYQRIKKAKANNPEMKIVSIDPRKTDTNEIVDLHLPIKSGMDVLLFNYLLVEVSKSPALNTTYIDQFTDGLADALLAAQRDVALGDVAERLGVDGVTLAQFVEWFIATPKAMTLFSMGVNQSGQGTDKVNAIINVHLATGRIGSEGAGPFSLTGQPNAMGGREVGGLANMLAAHLDIHEPSHRALVQDFWQSPTMIEKQGLKAVDLFDAVATGKVKAVWIMATNPIVSMPNADRVRDALANCPLVIVSDVIADTDCTRVADVVLPALGWGEKDGTVTNSERCISRQRGILAGAGESRADWWALAQVAQKMGFEGFDYQSARDVFVEHAALSGVDNQEGGVLRDFDISALSALTQGEYDALNPIQWPIKLVDQKLVGTQRLFEQGGFFTTNRRAKIVPVQNVATGNVTSNEFPYALNTGRIRDQWHTMTRTGLTSRLTRHIGEPFAELNPKDAEKLHVSSGDILQINSQWGQALARVIISDGQQPGMVFVPIHWNGINSTQSRIGAVVNPVVDPYSGQPECKHTPVMLKKAALNTHGFIMSLNSLNLIKADYAVNVRTLNGFRHEFAFTDDMLHETNLNLSEWLSSQVVVPVQAERMEYIDLAQGIVRFAWVLDQQLIAFAAIASNPDARATLPPRSWLDDQLGQEVSSVTRRTLLSGLAADPNSDVGPIVCSCFSVGKNTITRAIHAQNLTTVAAVGQCLKAGTNCGSCQSEIFRLLEQECKPVASAV